MMCIYLSDVTNRVIFSITLLGHPNSEKKSGDDLESKIGPLCCSAVEHPHLAYSLDGTPRAPLTCTHAAVRLPQGLAETSREKNSFPSTCSGSSHGESVAVDHSADRGTNSSM